MGSSDRQAAAVHRFAHQLSFIFVYSRETGAEASNIVSKCIESKSLKTNLKSPIVQFFGIFSEATSIFKTGDAMTVPQSQTRVSEHTCYGRGWMM